MIINYAISLSFLLLFIYVFLFSKSKLYKFFLFIMLLGSACYSYNPNLSTEVFEKLGMTSADLKSLFILIFTLNITHLNISKARKLDDQITKLTRYNAIQNVIEPNKTTKEL